MSKKTILLIDDSPEIRRQTGSLLKEAGFDVITAEDGDQGLEILKQIKPDIIFVDFIMPRVNGYRFCKMLLSDPATRDIPVVVLTEKKEDVIKTFQQRLGISHYLNKPFHPTEILSKINELIFKSTDRKKEEKTDIAQLRNTLRTLFREELRPSIKTAIYEVLKETDTISSGNVILSGRLGQVSVSDIIQFISMVKLSGKLTIISIGLNAEVYFKEGDILYSTLSTDEKSLSFVDYLARENRINHKGLSELISEAEHNDLPVEICAVNRGIVSWDDTRAAIKEIVQETLFSALSINNGHFLLEDVEVPQAIQKIGFRASAEGLLLDTLRRIDESKKDSVAK